MDIAHKRNLLESTYEELDHIYEALDNISPDSEIAAVMERRIEIRCELADRLTREIEAWECGAARRAAEARLAHHVEHDTLDLY